MLDFFTCLSSHQTGQGRVLVFEVHKSHEGLVLDVLGVFDFTVLDFSKHRESFFDFLFGDSFLQVSGKNICFVFIILIQVFQLSDAIGFLLGPVDVDRGSLVEHVLVLQAGEGGFGLGVGLEANKSEWSLTCVQASQDRSGFSELFANLF